MTPTHVVQITTPRNCTLNGLWFGPRKAKKVIILVHGLTGSAFSMNPMVNALVSPSTAVLTFNSRGFGQINSIKKGSKFLLAGTAHEVFTDCVDDIQGAINFAKKNGVRQVMLAGHSTGCQKIVYWASKRKDRKVKGLILFGPLSDYSGALKAKGKRALERGVAYARKQIAAGRSSELMPKQFVEWFACDAQRYVSLYSPDSSEEIFTYARSIVIPKTLRKVAFPTLVLLAGADEYGDMPPKSIAAWFSDRLKTKNKVVIVSKVGHSFKGGEKAVVKAIRGFMKEC
jgi:alpha-beta hydrolase superfamily lysophospholipase